MDSGILPSGTHGQRDRPADLQNPARLAERACDLRKHELGGSAVSARIILLVREVQREESNHPGNRYSHGAEHIGALKRPLASGPPGARRRKRRLQTPSPDSGPGPDFFDGSERRLRRRRRWLSHGRYPQRLCLSPRGCSHPEHEAAGNPAAAATCRRCSSRCFSRYDADAAAKRTERLQFAHAWPPFRDGPRHSRFQLDLGPSELVFRMWVRTWRRRDDRNLYDAGEMPPLRRMAHGCHSAKTDESYAADSFHVSEMSSPGGGAPESNRTTGLRRCLGIPTGMRPSPGRAGWRRIRFRLERAAAVLPAQCFAARGRSARVAGGHNLD